MAWLPEKFATALKQTTTPVLRDRRPAVLPPRRGQSLPTIGGTGEQDNPGEIPADRHLISEPHAGIRNA
jgi:hypothetical protein